MCVVILLCKSYVKFTKNRVHQGQALRIRKGFLVCNYPGMRYTADLLIYNKKQSGIYEKLFEFPRGTPPRKKVTFSQKVKNNAQHHDTQHYSTL